MEQVDTPELSSFRREVRLWLEANTPVGWSEDLEGADENERKAFLRSAQATLRAAGYLGRIGRGNSAVVASTLRSRSCSSRNSCVPTIPP